MDFTQFENPGKEFRPSPFWALNYALADSELVQQIKDAKEKGFGGFFMHSRVGLRTPYLADEWMARIKTCIEVAQDLDMEAWLYDEDRWPSGAAGGLVTEANPAFTAKGIVLKKGNPPQSGEILLSFTIDQTGNVTPFKAPNAQPPNPQYHIVKVTSEKMQWFNGECYIDTLNPAAVDKFIELTHEKYAKYFAEDFGKTLPGIFTDEPFYGALPGLSRDFPWTDSLPEEFKTEYGYDLIEHLPSLYFKTPNYGKVRYHFFRLLTLLFRKTYTKRLYDWCQRHGLELTGHFLEEDSLSRQTRHIGSAMAHYEYMQIPGIDYLGKQVNLKLTLKQLQSAGNQLGKKRLLSELFGTSGQGMTFEDQKWIADLHFAFGVNFLCPHLMLYTLKGEAKRDHPPTFSYHQPYWKHLKYLNDYFARASYFISQGRRVVDILLFHPIETRWCEYDPLNDPPDTAYDKRYDAFIKDLLALHRDFDLTDSVLMDNKVSFPAKNTVRIGEAEYRLIIVPPSENLAGNAFDALMSFGGPIVFAGERPILIDGTPSDDFSRLYARENVVFCGDSKAELALTLDHILPNRMSIQDEKGNEADSIGYLEKRDGDTYLYFFNNIERRLTQNISIRLPVIGNVSRASLEDGKIEPLSPKCIENGTMTIEWQFAPVESLALIVEPGNPTPEPPGEEKIKKLVYRIGGPWNFRRTALNAITLGRCDCSINRHNEYTDIPLYEARKLAIKHFGLEQYHEIQPWMLDRKQIQVSGDNYVKLTYRFNVEEIPDEIFAILEDAKHIGVELNGVKQPAPEGWHIDRQFDKIRLTGVKKGENIITVSGEYNRDSGFIEDAYLVGEFGVRGDNPHFKITSEPDMLSTGTWVNQGYPFYAGSMIYETEVELEAGFSRAVIDLTNITATVIVLSINGKFVKKVGWHPWKVDVTQFVKSGKNRLEIEVVSSLQNLLGPRHHNLGTELPWCGPEQFTNEQVKNYHFIPYGILGPIKVELTF